MTGKSQSVHPHLSGPQLLEGAAGKDGVNFFRGGGGGVCNFHMKNKI